NQDLYIHIFDEPGAYEVTQFVRNNNGCVDSSMQVVEVIPYPMASFYADADELFLPDSVMYFHNISEHAEDDLSDWDFGNGTGVEDFRDPYGIYPDSGLFQITLFVENELGCLDDTTQDLRVWEQETFYIASAFTPNEDGVNDIFDIQEKGIIEWHMVIYDRWGKVVFESRDVKESWNGRHMISGKELPQGGYAYSIQLKWYTGREFERMGTITLYR
ncbi:MAG: gliding motility-associated-like protein, partial [Oceanospirillaceae bacterium]